MNERIVGLDDSDILLNCSIDNMSNININQIGRIIDTNTNEVISYINPIAFLSKKKPNNYINKIKKLIENGSNMNIVLNYYGIMMNSKDILKKYNIKINL